MRGWPAAAIAALAVLAYVRLGLNVSSVAPYGIDVAGRAIAGEVPQVAYVFTASCFFPELVTVALLVIALAIFSRVWRARAIFAVIVTFAGWRISDFCKDRFMRPRPDYWVLHHETSYAYSSGHAMFAVLVYGLWAYFVATSPLPRGVRLAASTLLGLWACGVIWSRLALGAHYVSDLVGGVLLGIAVVSFGQFVVSLVAPRVRILSA